MLGDIQQFYWKGEGQQLLNLLNLTALNSIELSSTSVDAKNNKASITIINQNGNIFMGKCYFYKKKYNVLSVPAS